MKCFACKHEMKQCSSYKEEDEAIGLIETNGEYWECPNCGERAVPYATMEIVDGIRRKKTNALLWRQIVDADDFNEKYMQTHELAAFLGVSRQAICKSKTIVNLIYNMMIKGVRYWLRESAEQYKATGDGIFPLVKRPMVDVVPKISGKSHASSKPKAQSVKQMP